MEQKDDRLSRACASAGVRRDAGDLVLAGIRYAENRVGRGVHLTADYILSGVACTSVDQFGLLAMTVLRENGISTGRDVGRLVYAMIEEDILQRGTDDCATQFDVITDRLEIYVRRGLPVLMKLWGGTWML